MAVNGIEIKVGQKWRCGDGAVVTVESIDARSLYSIKCATENALVRTYTSDGVFNVNSPNGNYKLAELIEDAPAVEQENPGVEDKEESHSSIVMDVSGYEKLAAVLQAAYNQAAIGKGKERHANDKPFHEQPMCAISRNLGSIDGLLYQATKKPQEARGLPTRARALAEIYGAINYLAGAAILIEEGIIKEQE